jgi:O-antigen ligase
LFGSIQFWTTALVFVLAPIPFGSVDLFWVCLWTILLSFATFAGLSQPIGSRQLRVLVAFLTLCALYGVVAIVQISRIPVESLVDPIWRQAQQGAGLNVTPLVSSRAQIPPLAIGHFLLFATAFVSGFCIGISGRSSRRLGVLARYGILIYAIYGIGALLLTPNWLLWAEKTAYRGSLTGTFVNHNTAATLIGVGAVFWSCSAIGNLQAIKIPSLRVLLLSRANEALAFKFAAHSVAALICFFALVATGSRGGLICSFLGLVASAVLMIATKLKLSLRAAVFGTAGAFVVAGMLLSNIGRIAAHGLLDANRLSVYQAVLNAIAARPWLGWGLGSFGDAFPAFRSSDLPMWGVWDYAHSTVLELAFEMGLPLTAIIGLAALASIYWLAQGAVRATGGERQLLAAILGAAILTYLHAFVDFSLQIPGYAAVFGILLGCGISRSFSTRRRRRVRRGRRTVQLEPDESDGDDDWEATPAK